MNNYSFLCELTQHIINQRHYHNYSQIQRNVIHFLQTSKDNKAIIIKADFGSGKTFAYLIAMLNNISSTIDKLQSVILLPTRELALQTEEYIKPLSDKGLRYLLLIGGNANVPGKKKKDKIDLSLVPHVIIGTLGKVVSVLMKKGKLRYDDNMFYSHLANLVIDEADKMKNQNDKGTFSGEMNNRLPGKLPSRAFFTGRASPRFRASPPGSWRGAPAESGHPFPPLSGWNRH